MNHSLPGAGRCKQADDAVFRNTPDGTMILVPEEGTVHMLDEVGSRIWELCEEPVKASDVASTIEAEYDVNADQALRDVNGFMQKLLELGALVEVV